MSADTDLDICPACGAVMRGHGAHTCGGGAVARDMAHGRAAMAALRRGERREPVSADPERDGIYLCHGCGNSTEFIGTDAHGFGGPDACDGSCGFNPDATDEHDGQQWCTCDTVLTQRFTVIAQDGTNDGADIDYQSFEGGEDDAEIGTYTTIRCAECQTIIYQESAA